MKTHWQLRRVVTGFTLIELLVVIAIIGLIASVVLASLAGARRRSRDVKRIGDLRGLQTALELYFDARNCANFPCYPTLLVDLEAAASCDVNPCLAKVPTDPQGSGYPYGCGGAGSTTYHLGANLEGPNPPNPALAGDRDAANLCAGDPITNATDSNTGCNGAQSGRYCYDLTP